MANLIPQIAEMLGLQLGEEFKIKGAADWMLFHFDDTGLKVKASDLKDNLSDMVDDAILARLLAGHLEIVKLQWRPKFGDRYFGFFVFNGKLMITRYDIWRGTLEEEAQYKCGWIFCTRKEAEAALPKVAVGLGVDYEY